MTTRKFVFQIGDEWDGKAVKAFLKYHGFSAANVTALKNNPRGILIGNKRVTVLKQLHTGDLLTLRLRDRPDREPPLAPSEIPLAIVYEDEDIIVINKQAGLLTHPGPGQRNQSLGNALAFYWQQQKKEYGYHPVSRLDKDTTGLLVVAKNAYAAGQLGDQVKRRAVDRWYVALAEGEIQEGGTIDLPVLRAAGSVIRRTVGAKEQETDKTRAVTHFSVLKTLPECSLLLIKLETGRTHQIRVHMSHIGHPLCGDWLYGREGHITKRPALHSYALRFCHPVTGETMNFEAKLPQDIAEIAGDLPEIKRGIV